MTKSPHRGDERWGIDLGGTKIEGVSLDRATGKPLVRHRIATEARQGYDHIVDRIGVLLSDLETTSGRKRPAQVGIGTPGVTDPSTGRLMNSNTTALNGRKFVDDLNAAHGVEFIAANDANCFALAEATLGVAQRYGVVFGIIMGTGVGGGIIVNGRALSGAHGIAGEWGHIILEPEGDPCYCGRRGCVETVLSGPALERHYERLTGVRRPLTEIAARANESDPDAAATIARLSEKFGRAIATVINILDPDAIVYGGGVTNIRAFTDAAPAAITPWLFAPRLKTKLLHPRLGDSAGVFGAAMLVP